MLFLIRLIQVHESFRIVELESLATLYQIPLIIVDYEETCPYLVVDLPSEKSAATLLSRSVLSRSVHELWGTGTDLTSLHTSIKLRQTSHPDSWCRHRTSSFRFLIDCYQGSRSTASQRQLIDSFSYLDLQGPIAMKAPDEEFAVFEFYADQHAPAPSKLFFGRTVARSDRDAILKFDLKKRRYISTTSMDAELALISSNLALAAPGKVLYDPFCGTGSFLVAAAYHGAQVLGSDMDGRSIRGKPGRSLRSNFEQYGILEGLLGSFVADLTNSPVRLGRGMEGKERWLDAIVCDPPYGVREGLKVLGSRRVMTEEEAVERRRKELALKDSYLPPKKPYSFTALLNDILVFAAETLVDGGRLCLWMPVANDSLDEFAVPTHPHLRLLSCCVQDFKKWARRLLTYERLPQDEVRHLVLESGALQSAAEEGILNPTADDLNPFRRRYFASAQQLVDQPKVKEELS